MDNSPKTLLELLAQFRNKDTRWKAFRTMLIGVLVASGTIGATNVGTQSATGLWLVVMERFQFPMIQAEIESLRRDLAQAPCGSNAMLIATAANWNQRITHEHESNQHLYSDWASTNRWLAVERIQLPACPTPERIDNAASNR